MSKITWNKADIGKLSKLSNADKAGLIMSIALQELIKRKVPPTEALAAVAGLHRTIQEAVKHVQMKDAK